MNKANQLKNSEVKIKSTLTYPITRNDLLNSSFSDEDQDQQDFFSDCDIQFDNSDNYKITIEAFQTRVESEVVKILIEIYNCKIGNDQTNLSPSIQRFQSEIDYFTAKYNLQFSVYILQLLAEKLVDLVHRCKLKLNTDILYQDVKIVNFIKNKSDIEKAKNFLLGLNSIKQALVKTSKEIGKVFKSPIESIKTFPINIEEIIKELFYKEFIQEDEIIFNLIHNFKYDDTGIDKKDLKANNLLIEEEKYQSQYFSQKELDKFNEYLRQLETDKFEEDDEEEEEVIEKCSNDNEEECKCASLDIDELVQYINTKDSNNKPKKIKKKNKKRKKESNNHTKADYKNTKTIENTIIIKNNYSNDKMLKHKTNDKDVELFKENITKISTCAFTNHKIRPIISQEWLVKIERLMN